VVEAGIATRSRQETPMSEFTARANIKNFRAQLLTSHDEVQKATLRELLRDEEKILAQHLADRH
jgi:hypothetical protein